MHTRSWSRVLVVVLAVLCGVLAAWLATRPDQPGRPSVGIAAISSDPYPRLILRPSGTPLARAAWNALNGTDTKMVFGTLQATVSAPTRPEYAEEQALIYRIRRANGDNSTATYNYAYRALNYLYLDAATGYVSATASDPATKWASFGASTYLAQYEVIPVALAADWTDDASNNTRRAAIREWLCEWAVILNTDLGTLDAGDYINQRAGNVAALGIALMEFAGKSTGACSWPGSAEARIADIIAWHDDFLVDYWQDGYYYQQGPHYDDLSIQSNLVFLAAAEEAGLLSGSSTAAVNLLDGFLHQTIPTERIFQWGDTTESMADDLGQLHTHFAYLLHVTGHDPKYYWLWRNMRSGNDIWEETQPYQVAGGKALFLGYFDESIPTATPDTLSLFMRDSPPGTPEPVGGILSFRDSWSGPALAVNFINRQTHHDHNHYDYSGLEVTYAGVRFLTDYSGYYNDEDHGEAIFQNHPIFYDTTASAWGNLPSNDYTSTTADDSSAFGQIVAFADRPNVGSAVYADLRYGLVNQLDASRVFLPKATITPAPVGRRLLLFNRQAGQPPLLAVFDRTGLGAAKDWRTQWHLGSDLTITGSGTTAAPLVVSHANGATLYAFVSDGRSIVAGPDRVYDTSNCNNCEAPDTRNYVYYTQQSATSEPVLSTIWLASPGGAPTLTLEVLSSRNTYKIERPDASGYTRYVQNQGRTSITIGRVTTDAEAFLLNYDAGGNIIGGVFANYTALQDNGVTLDGLTNARVAAIEFAGSDGSARHGYASNSALATVTVGAPLTEATITPTATATRTATPTPTPSRTPTPVYAAGVRFNEVSPSELYDWSLSGTVSAADRYFELINWAATTANISGCTIGNGTDTYAFPTGTTLTAYARKVFLAEDTVHIPDNGTLTLAGTGCSASVVYTAAPDVGYCYSASPDGSGSFAWVAPENCTPGQPNP